MEVRGEAAVIFSANLCVFDSSAVHEFVQPLQMQRPPSTSMHTPVTIDASSLHK